MNIISIILLLIGFFLAITGFWRGITLKRMVMRELPDDGFSKIIMEQTFKDIKKYRWWEFGGGLAGLTQRKGEFIFNRILFIIGIIFIITGVFLIEF